MAVKQPTPALQAVIAASIIFFIRKGLRSPRRLQGIPEFAPVITSHLMASHIGILCVALTTMWTRRACVAGRSSAALLNVGSASLWGLASLACAYVMRRSLRGRAAFRNAFADANFLKPLDALPEQDASGQESGGKDDQTIGHLSAGRVFRGIFGLPILELRKLDVSRGIPYANVNGVPLYLDVIRRRGLPPGAPTFVYFHGGGWVMGDKSWAVLPLLYNIALKAGWVVLSANYRLSTIALRGPGGATFPDHLHDCFRAVAWARGPEACMYGAGGDVVVIGGESAGGHLACLLGLTQEVPRMRPVDLLGVNLRVDAIVDLYGVHDPRDSTFGPDFTHFFGSVVMKRKTSENEEDTHAWDDATPMWWVQQALAGRAPRPPPHMIVHGTHDCMVPVDTARRYSDALKEVRKRCGESSVVPDVYVEVPGGIHGFNFTHSPLSYALSDSVVKFLQELYARTTLPASSL